MSRAAHQNKTAVLVEAWYKQSRWLYALLPITFIYWLITSLRSVFYRYGFLKTYRARVPVIVVGNITAGGTGKSPVVIAIAKHLKKQGYKPGVISRGYGSQAPSYPFSVKLNSDPKQSGDEPLMIAKAAQVPVMISADRGSAIDHLLAEHNCDVVIADDGLQHHALARDIEIVVIDGQRQFGNGFLLPMGPLREPATRLESVDFCIYNGGNKTDDSNCFNMQLQPQALVNLYAKTASDSQESFSKVHAVSGIGNPQRFFNTLKTLGYEIIEHAFDDHYDYQSSDLEFGDNLPVVMTEKDAVKVAAFAKQNYWYLPVTANIDEPFFQLLETRLSSIEH